jgi:diamine N-acetyltransferase
MISLTNEHIKLRALEPKDIDFLFQTENDTSLWEISNTNAPFSKHILEQNILNAHLDIYQVKQLRLVIEHNSNPIGMIDLFDFDPYHHRAGIGIVILEAYQNNGFAKQALELLIQYAFEHLQLHQLYANITSDNTKSISLFTKLNFTETGVKKDWIKTKNGYKNEHIFQLTNYEN